MQAEVEQSNNAIYPLVLDPKILGNTPSQLGRLVAILLSVVVVKICSSSSAWEDGSFEPTFSLLHMCQSPAYLRSSSRHPLRHALLLSSSTNAEFSPAPKHTFDITSADITLGKETLMIKAQIHEPLKKKEEIIWVENFVCTAGGKGGKSTNTGNVPSKDASRGLASDTNIWSFKREERNVWSCIKMFYCFRVGSSLPFKNYVWAKENICKKRCILETSICNLWSKASNAWPIITHLGKF